MSQIFTIHQILEHVCVKNLKATILFVNFTKAFDPDYFNIVASVLQGDTLAPFLFVIC